MFIFVYRPIYVLFKILSELTLYFLERLRISLIAKILDNITLAIIIIKYPKIEESNNDKIVKIFAKLKKYQKFS